MTSTTARRGAAVWVDEICSAVVSRTRFPIATVTFSMLGRSRSRARPSHW